MIQFNEELHRYTDSRGDIYISSTQLIEKFHKKFDEDFWGVYKLLQYSSRINNSKIKKFDEDFSKKIVKRFTEEQYKYLQKIFLDNSPNLDVVYSLITEEEKNYFTSHLYLIKELWSKKNEESKILGTKFHNWKEDKQYKEGEAEYKGIKYQVIEDYILEDLKEGVYPEIRIWNNKFKIAGTVDQLIMYSDKTFSINDFKSNLEIVERNEYDRMLPPISHLEDCNYVHYTLQLSLYAWMLEEMGYKCRDLQIEHNKINRTTYRIDEVVKYNIEYKKQDIINMVNYYELQKSLCV